MEEKLDLKQLNPTAEGYIELANSKYIAGNFQEAIPLYLEALNTNRENYTAPTMPPYQIHRHIGLSYKKLPVSDTQSALKHFNEALKLAPSYAEVHMDKADLYIASGQYAEAIGCATASIDHNFPYPAYAHARLGLAYHFSNRLMDALASYDKAISIDPESPEVKNNVIGNRKGIYDAYHQSANTNMTNNKPGAALDLYNQLLARIPTDAPAHLGAGNALLALGMTHEARASFTKAAQYSTEGTPTRTEAQKKLAALAPNSSTLGGSTNDLGPAVAAMTLQERK